MFTTAPPLARNAAGNQAYRVGPAAWGLQFHIEELLAVRRVAVPGAVAQSGVATVLGVLLVRAFGWDWSAGLIFGMALAVASGVLPVFFGGTIFAQVTPVVDVPLLGELKFPTALLFDLGVYLVVVGVMLDFLRTLGAQIDPFVQFLRDLHRATDRVAKLA